MTKKLIYTLVSAGMFAVSCQKEPKIDTYDLGSEFFISSNITSFDSKALVSIDNQPKNLSTVEAFLINFKDGAYEGETKLGDIAITNGVGTSTYSASDLKISKIGDEATLDFKATFDNKPFVRSHSIVVANAVSYKVKDDSLVTVDVNTAFATIDKVTVKSVVVKKGALRGDLTDMAFEKETLDGTDFNGYILVKQALLTATDSVVVYEITTEANGLTQVEEVIVTVKEKE
ncbi:MAG: hypothetical protein KAG96_01655 [Ichthyobacteriaceae bacterium]|nr:hypothetical protein [Ichthyobacteriaceae bacterium]